MKIDMHFHSTTSDWYWTQEKLLEETQKRNLDFISLTDHDVISYGFREEAQKMWIQSCQSVEISVYNQVHDKSLHLTFYAREITQDISDILENVITQKQKLIELQVRKFIESWFILDEKELYNYFEKRGRNRNTLNKFDVTYFVFLSEQNKKRAQDVNGGVEIGIEAFYLKYLKRWWEEFENFAIQIPPYETPLELAWVFAKRCDGILSIPHANVTFRRGWVEEFEKVLPHYIENWVNALEINACMTSEWVEVILKNKDKYELYMTFGSDFHRPGIIDGKHWNLWEQNIYIDGNLVREEFEKYKKKIL